MEQLARAANRTVGRRPGDPEPEGGACRCKVQGPHGTTGSCRRRQSSSNTLKRRLEPELGVSRQGFGHSVEWDPSKAFEGASSPFVSEAARAVTSELEALRSQQLAKFMGWSSACSGNGRGVWVSWSHGVAWRWKLAAAQARLAFCRAASDGAASLVAGAVVRRWWRAHNVWQTKCLNLRKPPLANRMFAC